MTKIFISSGACKKISVELYDSVFSLVFLWVVKRRCPNPVASDG